MNKQLVLIVESNEAESSSLARIIRRGGYHAFECRTIAAAKESLRTKPEVVLLDVQLPDGSGIEFSSFLLADQKDRPAVIMMSAHDPTSIDHLQLFYSGAGAFLPKPIDPESLLRTIEQLAGTIHS